MSIYDEIRARATVRTPEGARALAAIVLGSGWGPHLIAEIITALGYDGYVTGDTIGGWGRYIMTAAYRELLAGEAHGALPGLLPPPATPAPDEARDYARTHTRRFRRCAPPASVVDLAVRLTRQEQRPGTHGWDAAYAYHAMAYLRYLARGES